MSEPLPIEAALPQLKAALAGHAGAVLEAPPGAGKSTVVPLALMGESWVEGRRLVMLEPRRLAARAVAARMALSLGETPGQRVGYRMRQDTRVSRATRIEVVTEGVLTRLLQEDASLEGVALVIFDEFHERSLQADLGLALTLDAQRHLRPDLKVLVMSATLAGEAVAGLLGDAPLIRAPGRSFPVHTAYAGSGPPLLPQPLAPRGADSPERRVLQLLRRALAEQPGDVLVFLPGAREIRRVQEALAATPPVGALRVLPLYGELAAAEQDAALADCPPGTRRVVLATNIAETSLTIPGVRVVIDSGLVRRARFDPASGMGRLETQRISHASAEQRAGRAGRTAPGACYRAWGAGAQSMLAAFTPPEIQDADLSSLALELAGWGSAAAELRWLDAPPPAQLASARELLQRLGALEADGRISAHGREMARLAVHPRLAHMLISARPLGLAGLAAELAALLSERDLLRGREGAQDADIRTRLEMLRGEPGAAGGERAAIVRARRAARELAAQLGARERAAGGYEPGAPGALLALAYPDRIGRRRAQGDGRYLLTGGTGAAFSGAQALARAEFIVAVDVEAGERDARIRLAAPLERADLYAEFAPRLVSETRIVWDEREEAVSARRTVSLDALVLEDKPLPQPPPEAVRTAMLAGVRALGLEALPWEGEARALRARLEFVRASFDAPGAWPEVSDAALLAQLEDWLGPYLEGVTRREHLARVPLAQALAARLSYAQQRLLDESAPTHLTLPSGTRVAVDYLDENAPAVAVRLQEVFGLAATPRLGRAQVPVTLRLLSPARRPLQVTRDLASFWRGAYAEVRKDMRGRYPKHYWPEDPLRAAPPARTPRRGRAP